MDLHEEYYNRRSLKSPLIKRPKEKSSLLLRRIDNSNKKQFFYILSECVYVTTEGGQRPPSFMHYIRGISKPVSISGGFNGQGVFQVGLDEKRIEWDAYETYMSELCASLNTSILKGYMPIKKEDALFHQWNIMVYFYGEVFSKYADIDTIAETFDDSKSPKDRAILIGKVVDQTLKFIDSSYYCFDNWVYLKNTTQFYDDWLADLIIGKIKST